MMKKVPIKKRDVIVLILYILFFLAMIPVSYLLWRVFILFIVRGG